MWNDALVAKDFSKVSSFYSFLDQAICPSPGEASLKQSLQPTMECRLTDLLKSLPIGTVTVDAVQSQGEDAYLHVGISKYPSDQTLSGVCQVPLRRARFAFVWRRYDSIWKITYHQSWALPLEEGDSESLDNSGLAVDWKAGTVSEYAPELSANYQQRSDNVEEN